MSKMAYRKVYAFFAWFILSPTRMLAQAPAFESLPQEGFLLPQRYRFTTPYSFALINKSPHAIWITLRNGQKTLLSDFFIAPSSRSKLEGIMASVNLKEPTILIINSDYKKTHSYQFPLGKTIYIVLDKKGDLRPQIGQMFGLKPASKAGFVLTQNVQPGDIQSRDE